MSRIKSSFWDEARMVYFMIFSIIYCLLFCMSLFNGFTTQYKCESPVTKGDIVMPGFRLGCWLATPLVEPKESCVQKEVTQ